MTNFMKAPQKYYRSLPRYEMKLGEEVKCRTIIILPTRRIHSSGYACMEFVLIGLDGKPLGRIGGGTDVVHIDGIGGVGWRFHMGKVRDITKVGGWSIDCLPCGLLQLWASEGTLVTYPMSSFEILALPKEEK